MKKVLLFALAAILSLSASAQFVRHTQDCGDIKANDGVTCSFGIIEDTDILDGTKTGFVRFISTSTRSAGGGTIQYEDLGALIQTLRYAKENPPKRGDDETTRIFFRTDELRVVCEYAYGSHPENYVEMSEIAPTAGIATQIPWSRLDELISMLEKCKGILDVHCAGN